jgi:5'-nucleotidase
MKLLLTNDDGIDAPGLRALIAAAQQIGEPIVIAPAEAHSGCSHQVTTDQPIRVRQRAAGQYVVEGTPADCVRVSLHRLVPEAAWVFSGINAGGNLGADVHHSGTVAAVREAVIHGWSGIAFSQYRRKGVAVDWQRSAAWAQCLISNLMRQPRTQGTFWNVNFPHLEPGTSEPEIVHCRLDPTPLPLSYREDGEWLHYNGDYHRRRRENGTDVDVCFNGKIAVTQMRLF